MLFCGISWGEELSKTSLTGLPLEEALEVFFTTFRDSENHIGVSRNAGYIVFDYGMAVIPYLKKRIKNADFFHFYTEPKDITLSLVSYIIHSLYMYSNPPSDYLIKPYTVPDEEIQWFMDEYKRRIDDYIMVTRVIDATVLFSETVISSLFATADDLVKYGHPYFNMPVRHRGHELKTYYEERLGISCLKVVPPFFE
ncbi:hypothetical protein FACS189462_0740 [Spirochaetia bacterium]|nr:hypothetical protein FACS189462_0740 [Spirochaetia bacterium]